MKKTRKLKSILSLTFLTLLSSCGGLQTAPYTVDSPLWEIGNHSLRDLFEDSDRLEDYQLIVNGDFSNGTTNWANEYIITFVVENGVAKLNRPTTGSLYIINNPNTNHNLTHAYYFKVFGLETDMTDFYAYRGGEFVELKSSVNNSGILNNSSGDNLFMFGRLIYNDGTYFNVDKILSVDITQMKLDGIRSDNNVLFSDMNNTAIKYQLDAWTQSDSNPYLYSYIEAKEVYPELTEQQFIRLSRDYETLKQIPQSIVSKFSIDDIIILVISFILWIVGIALAKYTETNWLYAISGLLWFVPLFIISNIFVIIFSISLMIFSFLYAFVKEE